MLLGMHQLGLIPQGLPVLSLGHELKVKVIFPHAGVVQTLFLEAEEPQST